MSIPRKPKRMGSAVAALDASYKLRILSRGLIAVLSVVAIFLFLFFPHLSGHATAPLPLLVITFAALRLFSKVMHGVLWFRGYDRQGRRRNPAAAFAGSSVDFVMKSIAGLLLGVVAVAASTMDMPMLGIAAAMTLLAATLIDKPYRGLFPNAKNNEQRERLRRQTLEALSQAVRETDAFDKPSSHKDESSEAESNSRHATISMIDQAG